jgi:SPX domain protein involved in polyphosphate accumulation
MRFGKTLQQSVYAPWRDHYIDYDKLKHLLRESSADSDRDEASSPSPSPSSADREWTERDESTFVEELVNVQLEKVHAFQVKMNVQLNERTTRCEQRLEKLVPGSGGGEYKPEERREILEQTLEELDAVTRDINELERFSRINFTGFLKAAKKHDRRYRGVGERNVKGKGRDVGGGGPKVRPLLQVRLGHLEFNKEDYSPLLYR